MSGTAPWSTLVKDAQAFLADLAQNNNRDWFNAHKPDYETRLKAPALALLDMVSAGLARRAGHPVTTKLWRPQRDIRFSKDKTPYHLHLHMGWHSDTGGLQAPGWFFGISPDYVCAGGGIMGFDKPMLDRWRKRVGGTEGAQLQSGIDTMLAQGFRIEDPELKRVPAPFDKDHPQAALLRRKSVVLWSDWTGADVLPWLDDVFDRLTPMMTHLAEIGRG